MPLRKVRLHRREVRANEKAKYLDNVDRRRCGGSMFLLGIIFSTPLLAQGHAGHTAQKPAATEKAKTVKPEVQQEEAAEEIPQIEISPEQQQLIGVKTVKVAAKPMQKVIRTVGRIEADEKKLATINTKVEGWIEKLYVDYTGRYVRKGEPLAEIYSPELLATQQEYLSILKWTVKQTVPADRPGAAQSGRDQTNTQASSEPVSELRDMITKDAKATLAAARERLRLWDISEEQINKIEETGKPVRTLILYSPVSGFVTQKAAIQGMKVMPGEKLFDIADLSTLWIIADIYEYELPFVRVGQYGPHHPQLFSGQGNGFTNRLYLSHHLSGYEDGEGPTDSAKSERRLQATDVYECGNQDRSR